MLLTQFIIFICFSRLLCANVRIQSLLDLCAKKYLNTVKGIELIFNKFFIHLFYDSKADL